MVSEWKRQALEGLASVFSGKATAQETEKTTTPPGRFTPSRPNRDLVRACPRGAGAPAARPAPGGPAGGYQAEVPAFSCPQGTRLRRISSAGARPARAGFRHVHWTYSLPQARGTNSARKGENGLPSKRSFAQCVGGSSEGGGARRGAGRPSCRLRRAPLTRWCQPWHCGEPTGNWSSQSSSDCRVARRSTIRL